MPRPYLQALQVKVISTLYLAKTDTHLRSHSLLANRTNRIWLHFHPFRSYNSFGLGNLLPFLYPLTRKLTYYIQGCDVEIGSCSSRLRHSMLPRDEISELAINISRLPNDRVVDADSKNFEENVSGVYAMVISVGRAGAFQVWANRRFIFIIESVFKSEAEGATLPN